MSSPVSRLAYWAERVLRPVFSSRERRGQARRHSSARSRASSQLTTEPSPVRPHSPRPSLMHGIDVIQIDCSKLTDERLPTLKVKMKEWFDEACWFAPSILVLDNLDRLLSVEVEVRRPSSPAVLTVQHADSFPTLHLTHTFLSTALPALASRPIILIATAISTASLHPLLSTTHLLGENVSLRGPGKSGRRDVRGSSSDLSDSFRSLPLSSRRKQDRRTSRFPR